MDIKPLMLAALLLSACGSSGGGSPQQPEVYPPWRGGLIGVWEPASNPRGAIILHQGHSAWHCYGYSCNLTPIAQRFAYAGYVVYGMEMPPDSPHEVGPIDRFIDPVRMVLDAIEPSGLPIYMVGLSGGGWTTTVTTYLDSRIKRGYSVAGDHPVYSLWGDWESKNPPADYLTMYAAAGSRLVHIYNFNDPCCFAGIEGDQGFPYVNDTTHDQHEISPWAVYYILADMAGVPTP